MIQPGQFRRYIVTQNNPVDWKASLEAFWNSGKFKYVCGQLEKGENTGTPHLQCFLWAVNSIRIVTLRTMLDAHYEVVQKDNGAADYCMKEDTRQEGPLEFGVKPKTAKQAGVASGEARKARNLKIVELGPLKAFEEGIFELKDYDRIKKCLGLIALDSKPAQTHDDVRGVWIYGLPGVGKSHYAREHYPDIYIKSQNKWWDGYNGQNTALLDDYDADATFGHLFKIWADKWNATGEIKGGTVPLNYSKFVVTSNYTIRESFESKGEVLVQAILRRFKVIHIVKLNGVRNVNIS